jgi:LuxR family maltose regulon positive regulatory protein
MDTLLLATKMRIPPQPHYLVPRARLVDALEEALPRYKLILLSAPAGYGKTTLLAEWAHASRRSIAWLSVSEADNDLASFLRSLLAAWKEIQPGIRETPLDLLLSGMAPEPQAVLSAFINVANGVANHTTFVLDDYHLIEEPSIHRAVTFLLDHLPPSLHFVLAGRTAPRLPLARYRARQELLELRAEDLHFLVEETEAFLNRLMGLELTPGEIVALHAQLEGWVAGLQLVSLTLRRHREAGATLVVSGRHRFIADYLSDDVLAHLPEALQRFLLQTSILDRLCGPLCDAVTETDASHEMLKLLERENLFLMPLDDRREWFRYHRLFADFLHTELTQRHPREVAQLHRRAATWYLAHDLPEPAFRHAVDGDAVELVIQIGERYVAPKLFGGEVRVVEQWLAAIPPAWYARHPTLGLVQSIFLIITGAFDTCVRCLDEVEQRLALAGSADLLGQLAKVAALRCALACFQNDLPQAELYADLALRDLREEDCAFRADTYHALGDTYRGHGRWSEARACYIRALDCSHDSGAPLRSAHVFGALADLELRQGHLRDAAGYWRKALATIQQRENWGHLPLPVIGWVYLRMAEIHYEWNQLGEASDHLVRGLERSELGGDMRAMLAGHLIAGRLKLTEGDLAAAGACLERAQLLVEHAPFPDWVSRFERFQIELWLAQRRLRAAVIWADASLQNDGRTGRGERELAHLSIARVLILKGDAASAARALALLQRLMAAAEAESRLGVMIEALALQAVAHWDRGDQAGALTALERALRLAEPEGYVRLFADLGRPVARLLQEARSRAVLPQYVETLLMACHGDSGSISATSTALPEPLTSREQDVLERLAAGLTNREIAAQLLISAETVKKHVSNICAKLGVSNRTEAAARARELDLLH